MRRIPPLFAAALNSTSAIEPTVFCDIYYHNEGGDSLATRYRLEGRADASHGEDVTTEYNTATHSMMLGMGAAHAPDTAPALANSAVLLQWWSLVTELHNTSHTIKMYCAASDPLFGYCLLWLPTIVPVHHHVGFSIEDGARVLELPVHFVDSHAKRVDSLCLGLGNAGGNLAAKITAEIVDPATGIALGGAAVATLAAGAAHAKITFGGMMAQLFGGREYLLRLSITPIYTDMPPIYNVGDVRRPWGCDVTVGGLASTATDWVVPLRHPVTNASLGSISLGGFEQYTQSGRIVRNLDMGALPVEYGTLGLSSVVPLGTTLTIGALYACNDAAVAAETTTIPAHWTLVAAPYSDGMSVPPYRYWRAVVNFTANAASDLSPQLLDLVLVFSGIPLTLGTMAGAVQDASGRRVVQAVRAIHTVSALGQSLDPKTKTTMIGGMSIELAPEPEVISLASQRLRGKRIVVRAGCKGVDQTMMLYGGVIRDLAWTGGRFILTTQDAVELADVSIPNVRHAAWDAVTSYADGALVVVGDKAYRSLQNGNLNHAISNVAWWAEYPSVWVPITYPVGTHLADIALDLLANQANLPDRFIDSASLAAIKAVMPSRTLIAAITFDTPTKARQLLDELALLLEAQWVVREGRLALIADAAQTSIPVDVLTPHDIKDGIDWRRGWADLKNEVLVLSGYSNVGGSETWSRGQAYADAQSVTDYGITVMTEIRDRFGLSEAELASIASTYIARWKNGRRLIRCDAYLTHLGIEAGDVVRLRSSQLPATEPQDINCICIQSSLDWMNLTLKLTLMEA